MEQSREAGMSDRVETICPCCSTKLVVDTDSGEILSEERPKADHLKSFDDAMTQVQGSEARRKDAFDKAFDRTNIWTMFCRRSSKRPRKRPPRTSPNRSSRSTWTDPPDSP